MKLALVVFAAFKVWTASGVNTVGPLKLTQAEQIEQKWSANEDEIKRKFAKGQYDGAYTLVGSNIELAAQYARQSDMLATSLEELGLIASKLGNHRKSAECFELAVGIAKDLKHWPETRISHLEADLKQEETIAQGEPPSKPEGFNSAIPIIELARATTFEPRLSKSNQYAHTLGLQADLAFKKGLLNKAEDLQKRYSDCAMFLCPVKNEELVKARMHDQLTSLALGSSKDTRDTCDFTDYLTGSYLADDDPIRIRTSINRALANCIEKKYLPVQDDLKSLHERQKLVFEKDQQLEGLYNLAMAWACYGESSCAGTTWLQPASDHADKAIAQLQNNYSTRMDYAQALRLSGLILDEMKDPRATERSDMALSVAASVLPPNHPYLAKFYRDFAYVILGDSNSSGNLIGRNAHTGLALAQKLYHRIPTRPDDQERRLKRLESYRSTLESALKRTTRTKQTELEI